VLLDLMQRSFCIFLGLLGEDDIPTHQPREFDDCSKDSAIPSRMDSLIPGKEEREFLECFSNPPLKQEPHWPVFL
jgi:hypothetical protein